ncbi:hypothetical protein [Streptosporangium sp. NPDC002607]
MASVRLTAEFAERQADAEPRAAEVGDRDGFGQRARADGVQGAVDGAERADAAG